MKLTSTSTITIFILLSASSALADDINSWQAQKNTINPAVADYSDGTGEKGGIPGLMGAVQIGQHSDVQPTYCYPPTQPDYSCYKDGYPKCCNKQKGNRPNGKVPSCEVQPQPQPRSPTRKPTTKPSPPTPDGQSICTRSPDYKCYKTTGRPECCYKNNGKNCPTYMTMCNNYPEGYTGWDYCTRAPDNNCYPYSNGRPACCSQKGGGTMNCPKQMPGCENKRFLRKASAY
jgi:hypothetical protein